jgi:hypothetical protein
MKRECYVKMKAEMGEMHLQSQRLPENNQKLRAREQVLPHSSQRKPMYLCSISSFSKWFYKTSFSPVDARFKGGRNYVLYVPSSNLVGVHDFLSLCPDNH